MSLLLPRGRISYSADYYWRHTVPAPDQAGTDVNAVVASNKTDGDTGQTEAYAEAISSVKRGHGVNRGGDQRVEVRNRPAPHGCNRGTPPGSTRWSVVEDEQLRSVQVVKYGSPAAWADGQHRRTPVYLLMEPPE